MNFVFCFVQHSSNLKALTLPQTVSGRFLIENINLSSHGTKELEAPKVGFLLQLKKYEVYCKSVNSERCGVK